MSSKSFCIAAIAVLAAACASTDTSRAHGELQAILDGEHGAASEAQIDARIAALRSEPLTLEAAISIALAKNADFRAKLVQLDLSDLDLAQAALFENPVFGASVRWPHSGGANSEFSLAWNVLDVFLRSSRQSLAQHGYARSLAELAFAARTLVRDVQRAFFELEAAEREVALADANTTALRVSLELAERQWEAGTINQLDLALRRAESSAAELDRLEAGERAIEPRARLARCLGQSTLGEWKLAGALAAPQENVPTREVVLALAARCNWPLRALDEELAALEQARELSRESLFGFVHVGVDTERDVDGSRVTGPTLELGLPIFDANRVSRARIEAEIAEARSRRRALEVELALDVESAHAQWLAARERYQRIELSLVPERREIERLALEHYNGMLIGVYDLLKVHTQLVDAEKESTRALRDVWLAHAELELACGRALDDPQAWNAPPAVRDGAHSDGGRP